MLKQFLAYNAVGIVNTLFGFTLIFGLMFLGVSPEISNLIGYVVGASLSYLLNSKYTFQINSYSYKQMVNFFGVLFIGYILNFLTLQYLLPLINPYGAQIIAGIVYTVSSFVLMRLVVFKI